MTRYYTGVGSRETPAEVQGLISSLARSLAQAGFCLRSGAALGADTAFERGALAAQGATAVFLPWKGYNDHESLEVEVTADALALAATLHPAWESLGQGAQKLHARNCYQVLGRTLDIPSLMLICWTPDGCESKATRRKGTGGTATAIVLAEQKGVPVFNLKNSFALVRLREFLVNNEVDVPAELLRAIAAVATPEQMTLL